MTNTQRAAVVVAHPDDETLWAGGAILARPDWRWAVVTLCRRSDPDREPRFSRALESLGATGAMGDADDGPDQLPLDEHETAATLRSLLPQVKWDVLFTHSPFGEYTRHRRHEEVSRAVLSLWARGDIQAREVRLFAYEDGEGAYYPKAIERAHVVITLDESVWLRKRAVITNVYGFSPDSWETQTTPRAEAFWRFEKPKDYNIWLKREGAKSAGGVS
jgi:LmbE family N-acetylglucosaminyl deacetylase